MDFNCQDEVPENMRHCGDIKIYRIRLFGHCVFCLRRTVKSGGGVPPISTPTHSIDSVDQLEQVPQAIIAPSAAPILLSTFNRLWPYLQQKNNNCPFGFPTSAECKNPDANKRTYFSRLPKMCQLCADKLIAIDRLWRELVEQILGLKASNKESQMGGKFSFRAEQFREALVLREKKEEDSVRGTLEFLDILGGASYTKAKDIDLKTSCRRQEPKEDKLPRTAALPTGTTPIVVDPTNIVKPPPVLIITEGPLHLSLEAFGAFSRAAQAPGTPVQNNNKQLVRQNSVEVIKKCESPPGKLCQQSSDIFTSHENEMSFEQEEAELADDESEPDYVKLEKEDGNLTGSDYDSTDDEEDSVAYSPFEKEHADRITNQNLSNILYRGISVEI